MKRGIHVSVSLLAVVLLARPFDCFAGLNHGRESMECCLQGKCAPTAQSDDCCKNTVPDGGQLVQTKGGGHSAPLVALSFAPVSIDVLEFSTHDLTDSFRHPPPSPGLTSRNLPLLI
jgi:hypothetical protein